MMITRNLCLAATLVLTSGMCNAQTQAPASSDFKKHVLTTEFKTEGVAVADVNKDGKIDIIGGPEWFEAPNWTKHTIYESRVYKPGTEYATSFLDLNLDVNFDGWDDLVLIDFPGKPGTWYENPKNKPGLWPKHSFLPNVSIGNESPAFVDVDGDGRLDILCADSKAKKVAWIQAPVKKGDTTWNIYYISKEDPDNTFIFTHGLGYGDLNGDGRKDVFTRRGWWEGPADVKQNTEWVYHPTDLGEDCAHMHAFDVNGDGLMDVISSSAHKIGIWWHQQVKDAQGNISFKHNLISNAFSQTHSMSFEDVNKDGYKDVVVGKRFFAHGDTEHDPGAHDPSVLYWFEYTPKAPYFIPHQVDDNSGAGLNTIVKDINKDKKVDIIIANKKGVFYFENQMQKKKKK